MIKRTVALFLTLAMLWGMAACGNSDGPVITGSQTETTEEIENLETTDTLRPDSLAVTKSREEAYREVVQEYVDRYGIVDISDITLFNENTITNREIESVLYVNMLDFTGDGEDELLILWREHDNAPESLTLCNFYIAIYGYEQNKAVLLLKDNNILYYQVGHINLVKIKDQYAITTSDRWYTGIIYYYIDGQMVNLSEIEPIIPDISHLPREITTYSTDSEEARFHLETRLLHAGLSLSDYEYIECIVYDTWEGIDGTVSTQSYDELISYMEQLGVEVSTSKQQLLMELPYFGDRNLCKMSAAQAKAYAEMLERLPHDLDGLIEDSSFQSGQKYQLSALLIEPTGDGVPILMTVYSDNSREQEIGALIEQPTRETSISFWQWNGTTLEQLVADDLHTHPSTIHAPVMAYGYDFTSRDEGFYFEVGGIDSMGNSLHTEYQLQNGQIEYSGEWLVYGAFPVEHVDGFVACYWPGLEDEKTIPAPFTMQVHPIYETMTWIALEEDIEAYGWEPRNPSSTQPSAPYSLYVFNGTIVTEEETSRRYLPVSISHGSGMGYSMYGDWRDGKAAAATLREYAELLTGVSYDYPEILETLPATQRGLLEKAAEGQVPGTLGGLYDLSNDLYYAVYYDADGSACGGVLLRQNLLGYRMVESHAEPATQAALQSYVDEAAATPNINLDYNEAGDDPVAYLKQALEQIDGTAINDAAKQLLASYTEAASADSGSFAMSWTGGLLRLPAETIAEHVSAMETMKTQLQEALGDITLNKTLSEPVQIYCPKWEPEQPIQLVLDRESMEASEETDGVQLIFGSGQHSITVEQSAWKQLMEQYDTLVVQVQQETAGYSITYSQEDGTPIDQLPAGVTFTLPASTETATVLATYDGGTSDNWGGQYDARNGTVQFTTPYSGTYQVIDNAVSVQDLQDVDAETAAAITFMVSKGYFAVDDSGNFYPDATLNRYEFAEALVRMFFALDRSLTSSFTDVQAESPYYAYVASGEQRNIIQGYEDQTFRGENPVLREQIIALCSRTLVDYRGYLYPETPEEYLQFSDAEAISDWANDTIALAVRELLIDRGGELDPQSEVTRAEAAQMLYRLFMLLYETPMVDLEAESADENRLIYEADTTVSGAPIVAVGGGVLAVAAGAIWYCKRRKKA